MFLPKNLMTVRNCLTHVAILSRMPSPWKFRGFFSNRSEGSRYPFGQRRFKEQEMAKITLKAEKRGHISKGLYALRQSGQLPAVLYGPGFDTLSIQLPVKDTTKKLNGLSGSTLIHLSVEGKEYQVLLREVQRDSIRQDIVHVDFYAVPPDRIIKVRVPLEFTGISVAVRDFGGVLVHLVSDLTVECLPKDLVSKIKVDLGALMKIGDAIAIKDINLPAGINVHMDMHENVVTVTAQAAEEEPVVVAGAAATPDVEVIEKGKKLEEGEEEEKPKEKEKK
jgi:large subunit ribosomal protein L25